MTKVPANVDTGDGLRQSRAEFIGQKSVGVKRKFAKTAHFPGTGPKGARCMTCEFHLQHPSKNIFYCSEWVRLTNGHTKDATAVNTNTPACEYYKTSDER